MSIAYQEKAIQGLTQLGLVTALSQLDQTAQRAAAETWSYTHFLGYLLEGELVFRHEKTVRLNLQFARLPYLKRIEDFDFAAQPSLDPRLVEELFTLRLLADGRNVVLLGPPGVGKTHLAIAMAVRVAEAGHRVYFTTAIEMARRLTKALAENHLRRELQSLVRPRLLVIDEMGYLSLDPIQASVLFQVICERYERNQPIVLTSNKAFADWGEVFAGDPVLASAALDRLLHRSTVINVHGESYRLKEKRQAGTASAIPSDGGAANMR
ncbi:MAG: IS21-like element helper ATPase IstB [Thermoanaerobaculia bacterium]